MSSRCRSRCAWRAQGRRPQDGRGPHSLHDGYGVARPVRLAGHRLARAPALGPASTARPVERDRARRRARRCCSCTASPAAGRTGWRTCPGFAAHAPRDRRRPARLRRLADAARARSRSPATRASSTGCCDALAIDAAAVVGNSMGGFIAAELAIASRSASSGWCSSRPPASRAEHRARATRMHGRRTRASPASRPRPPRGTSRFARRAAACAGSRCSFVVRHPERLPAALAPS